MKMIFKVARAAGFIWLLIAVSPATVEAESVYFTTRGVLKEFFPKSQKVGFLRLTPTSAQRLNIKSRLGYALQRKSYVFYVAKTGDRVDGYAFIDNQKGQHLPITFAVKLSRHGVVQRQEVIVYREPRGDEILDSRFRRQFVGKTAKDPVRANVDIVAISGATISSNAMAVGVKRALVLLDVAAVARPRPTKIGRR